MRFAIWLSASYVGGSIREAAHLTSEPLWALGLSAILGGWFLAQDLKELRKP